VADPQYLAETLALGVDAAGLRGWSEGDAQSVYAWLLTLLNERPLHHWVRAKNRMGYVLVEALRLPHSRTEFKVQLTVTETDTALLDVPQVMACLIGPVTAQGHSPRTERASARPQPQDEARRGEAQVGLRVGSVEYRDLVTQDEELDVFGRRCPVEQCRPSEESDGDQVGQV
jgi:hypothetical protein